MPVAVALFDATAYPSAIDLLVGGGVRGVSKDADILRLGERPQKAHRLLKGFACRYQLLRSGRRQITAILVPGDICDLEASHDGGVDYAVAALTPCAIGDVVVGEIDGEERYMRLRRDDAISRQWIVSLGQRTAVQRLAHLLCELNVRLSSTGYAVDNSYHFPICQSDLADALGLSTVHMNRSWQELRRSNLIHVSRRRVSLPDLAKIEALASFSAAYLDNKPCAMEASAV